MSHSIQGGYARFHYDADISGKVRIVLYDGGGEIEIPAVDLVDFVMEAFIKPELVSRIEQLSIADLFKRKE